MTDWIEANKASWNERVGLHLRDTSGTYGLDAFKRGDDILGPIESAEVGDVAGKRLVHLQCHFGMDTLSLARRGAEVTGLDFSETAIEAARDFAAEQGVDVRFVVSDVHDAPAATGGGFDIAYVTWGALGWLPSMERWADAVSGCLRAGGYLYLAEGHPVMWLMQEDRDDFQVAYDWNTPEDAPIREDNETSYAGDGSTLENRTTFGWNHPLSSVIMALLDRGFRLDFLHEHDRIPWRAYPWMVDAGQRMFGIPDDRPKIPLAYSLKATKVKGPDAGS